MLLSALPCMDLIDVYVWMTVSILHLAVEDIEEGLIYYRI